MLRYLVVADQALGSDELYEAVRRCVDAGPCTFHITVPATHPTEHLTWSEGEAHAIASERLDRALAWFRELGLEVDGEVGDGHPLLAIWDALGDGGFDQIILATLPAGLSRWLGMDLPARVRAAFDLPVTHIVAEVEPRRARR
jgi:hypothetical protein